MAKANLPTMVVMSRKGGRKDAYPVPPEVYRYVQDDMRDLPLKELRKRLEVSKRVAKALRDGVQISLPHSSWMILNDNIKTDYLFGIRYQIRWAIEKSPYRELYVALNRYLAKMIAEMPQDVAKLTRGGWLTKYTKSLKLSLHWVYPMSTLLSLADMKRWFALVHKRWPEFDQILFGGTGLFDDVPADETTARIAGRVSAPIRIRRPRKKKETDPAHYPSGRPRRDYVEFKVVQSPYSPKS